MPNSKNGNPQESFGLAAGFYYSRIDGGDRLSSDQTAGVGTPRSRNGFKQRWNLGSSTNINLTALPSNSGDWPSEIKLNWVGTNPVAYGQSSALSILVQWARDTTTLATIDLDLDDDFNPHTSVRDFYTPVTTEKSGSLHDWETVSTNWLTTER